MSNIKGLGRIGSKVGLGLAALLLTAPAFAVPIQVGFTRITNNNVEDVASQLSVSIYDSTDANTAFSLGLTAGQFLFTVQNAVGTASSVSEFYLADTTGLTFGAIHNSLAGFTQFTGPGANPGNLPGGTTVGFTATSTLSVDAVGNPSRGVDSGIDILGVRYGSSLTLAQIQTAINSGSLRIGMHLRAIGAAGGSDSFVNGRPPPPPMQTPEPGALALLGLGMMVVGGFAKRRRV